MKYILNKYEKQEIDDETILFLLDNNNNIMLEQCIVLEGSGKIFMESVENCNNVDDVERMLLSIFINVNKDVIRKDLNDFIDSLINFNLLYWSNDNG